jgi:hypothetical protein
MGAIDTAQSKAQWGWRANFFRNRCFTAAAADGILSRYVALLLQADSGLPQGHFLRWWETAQKTSAITQEALTESTFLDYIRFQVNQNPVPAAASVNRRVGTAERAMRREFPDIAPLFAPGFQNWYWRPSRLGYRLGCRRFRGFVQFQKPVSDIAQPFLAILTQTAAQRRLNTHSPFSAKRPSSR